MHASIGPRSVPHSSSVLLLSYLFVSHIDMGNLACHPTTMRLLEQVYEACMTKHYSPRTEESYVRWIERFLRFHRNTAGKWIHPRDMTAEHVESFLTHLAVRRHVAASTQNQALNALVFLFRDVVKRELEEFIDRVVGIGSSNVVLPTVQGAQVPVGAVAGVWLSRGLPADCPCRGDAPPSASSARSAMIDLESCFSHETIRWDKDQEPTQHDIRGRLVRATYLYGRTRWRVNLTLY